MCNPMSLHLQLRLHIHVRLNVGSSPTVGAVYSAMKAKYVVVAEQAHYLGPAYHFPMSLHLKSTVTHVILHAIILCPCLHAASHFCDFWH